MVKITESTKDHPNTEIAKTGRVFFLLGKKRSAIKVPIGIEKKIGVKKAIPNKPYLRTVLIATTLFNPILEFAFCLLDIQVLYRFDNPIAKLCKNNDP